jgi:hypothetical protein
MNVRNAIDRLQPTWFPPRCNDHADNQSQVI